MVGKISATEIDSWAKSNPRRAQEILPELILRLILATSKSIVACHFPIEKGIQFAGYDGVLDVSESTSFFPRGKSVWEFGTDTNAINKFRSDIKKRSSDPLGENISETTFIFATLKFWNHRTSISEVTNESKSLYGWKDIRIIDASDITLWLTSCPGVSIWMCEHMGKRVSGVLSIEQYWDDYCNSTTPILTREYFLLNREKQIKDLTSWLHRNGGFEYRVLIAESSLEATLFLVASLLNISESNDNDLKAMKSKTLIITSSEAWNDIISHGEKENGSIFIPIFNFTEDIRCPNNISAVLPISKYSPSAKITRSITKIELPMRTKDQFTKVLESLGYPIDEAYDIGAKTKRKFLSFYRMITRIPTRINPRWTTHDNLRELIPALLTGGWNDKFTGDKEIIERMCGTSYEEYIKTLSKWTSIEDAPLFSVERSYQIVSIQDSWDFLFGQLVPSDITALSGCIREIFSTVDPALYLPENRRFGASLFGKYHKYSTSLQKGYL